MANFGLPQVDSHKLRRSAVHLGYTGNLQGAKDPYRVPAKDSSRLAALPKGGMLRGPNRLGNLVMPELLRRASVCQLSVKGIRRASSPKKTLQISSERSAGLWMSSLRRGSPQAG